MVCLVTFSLVGEAAYLRMSFLRRGAALFDNVYCLLSGSNRSYVMKTLKRGREANNDFLLSVRIPKKTFPVRLIVYHFWCNQKMSETTRSCRQLFKFFFNNRDGVLVQ